MLCTQKGFVNDGFFFFFGKFFKISKYKCPLEFLFQVERPEGISGISRLAGFQEQVLGLGSKPWLSRS